MNERLWNLTGETKLHEGRVLNRLKYGSTLGGWVENPEFISHQANVRDNAMILGNSYLKGKCCVASNAVVKDSYVGEKCVMQGSSLLDSSRIDGIINLSGNAIVKERCHLHGNFSIGGNVVLENNVSIHEYLRSSITEDQVIRHSPLILKGLEYDIIVTDTRLQIGCQSHTFKEWKENEDLWQMNLEFYKDNHKLIRRLVKHHRKFVKLKEKEALDIDSGID